MGVWFTKIRYSKQAPLCFLCLLWSSALFLLPTDFPTLASILFPLFFCLSHSSSDFFSLPSTSLAHVFSYSLPHYSTSFLFSFFSSSLPLPLCICVSLSGSPHVLTVCVCLSVFLVLIPLSCFSSLSHSGLLSVFIFLSLCHPQYLTAHSSSWCPISWIPSQQVTSRGHASGQACVCPMLNQPVPSTNQETHSTYMSLEICCQRTLVIKVPCGETKLGLKRQSSKYTVETVWPNSYSSEPPLEAKHKQWRVLWHFGVSITSFP